MVLKRTAAAGTPRSEQEARRVEKRRRWEVEEDGKEGFHCVPLACSPGSSYPRILAGSPADPCHPSHGMLLRLWDKLRRNSAPLNQFFADLDVPGTHRLPAGNHNRPFHWWMAKRKRQHPWLEWRDDGQRWRTPARREMKARRQGSLFASHSQQS